MKEFLLTLNKQKSNHDVVNTSICNPIRRQNITFIGFEQILYQETLYDILVDGELYNGNEISDILVREGYPITDNTSIEELFLFAYLLWAHDAMLHLEGAYSFTIFNGSTILIAKDPLGLKPIFYKDDNDSICISNRIRTIIKETKTPAILDREGIIELFAFGPSLSEDKTLFKSIQALPMGNLMIIKDNMMKRLVYYKLPTQKHVDTIETTISKVHDLVSTSIIKQMDNCNASFLSGGLDSSIITSICAKRKKNWHTYSLDYEGNKENFKGNLYQVSLDNAFIDAMSEYCESEHTYLTIKQQELVDLLPDAMLARDHPGMADVDSSLLWLCKQVSEKERIVLSGECSDEIFGGYPWFYRDELKDLKTFPWLRSTEDRISFLNDKIKSFDYKGYIQQRYESSIADIEYLDTDSEEDKRARLHTNLCLHWFMQTLVTRQVCEGDAAHMNIRAPFANVKLLEYVYNIPWKMKFLKQQEKGILREAFANDLPIDVAQRKKNPFPKTHNPVYAQMVSEQLKERLTDENSVLHLLFDEEKVMDLINTKGNAFELPWYGQLMSGPQLLAYLCQIDEWVKQYDIKVTLD